MKIKACFSIFSTASPHGHFEFTYNIGAILKMPFVVQQVGIHIYLQKVAPYHKCST